MKTFSKTLVLGVFLAVLAVAAPTFAQGDVCADLEANQALYDVYISNYKGALDQKKKAVKAGEEYVQKYSSCENYKAQVDYLNKAIPKLKEIIDKQVKADETAARYTRFDNDLKSINGNQGNVSGVFNVAREILVEEPEFLDVILAVATVGFDQAAQTPPNNTYNEQTVKYAKSAISMLEANKESRTGKFGVLGYEYENKANALGWMHYIIGYISYYRDGTDDLIKDIGSANNQLRPLETELKTVRDKLKKPEFKDDAATIAREAALTVQINGLKARIEGLNKTLQAKREKALPTLFEAIQIGQETKENPFIYATIGDYYFDEILRLADQVIAINERNGGKESYDSEYKFAIQKGYADRAIDAYARSYKLATAAAAKAKTDAAKAKAPDKAAAEAEAVRTQAYAEVVYETLKKVYSFRFGVENAGSVDGYVSAVTARSMPNPMSDVQPVDPPAKPEPVTDSANTSTSMNGAPEAKSDADKTNGKPKNR